MNDAIKGITYTLMCGEMYLNITSHYTVNYCRVLKIAIFNLTSIHFLLDKYT